MSKKTFDLNCRLCPRLFTFLEDIRKTYPDYHGRPVPPFGASDPDLLIVGLAPGMHGANATGRPFTGDFAGILLYETLHKYGFSNKCVSESADDGLKLKACRITNAVKCLPPQNKPVGDEIRMCNRYLKEEIAALRPATLILALGTIAHLAVLRALDLRIKNFPFGHGREHALDRGRTLIDSYHCSRYNTQTKRLTEKMFHDIFVTIRQRISEEKSQPVHV